MDPIEALGVDDLRVALLARVGASLWTTLRTVRLTQRALRALGRSDPLGVQDPGDVAERGPASIRSKMRSTVRRVAGSITRSVMPSPSMTFFSTL